MNKKLTQFREELDKIRENRFEWFVDTKELRAARVILANNPNTYVVFDHGEGFSVFVELMPLDIAGLTRVIKSHCK